MGDHKLADAPIGFPIEQIPDESAVLLRVHKSRMRDGMPAPGAFTPNGEGLSVDWDKYSTAVQARARAKKPAENAVVRLVVAEIRAIEIENHGELEVEHRPLTENPAHSEVPFPHPERGDSWLEARVRLNRIANVEIRWDAPFEPN